MLRTFTRALAPLALFAVLGCEPPPRSTTQPASAPAASGPSLESVAQQAKEAVGAGADYLRAKQQEYRERFQPELDRLARRADKLRQQAQAAAEQAQPEVQRRITQLQEQARLARERWQKLQDASGPAWEEARRGFEQALDELRSGLDEPAQQPATTAPAATTRPRASVTPDGLSVQRIAAAAVEFGPVDPAAPPETLEQVARVYAARLTAASDFLGQSTVRVRDGRALRIELSPAVITDPEGDKLVRQLGTEPGIFALRLLVRPKPDQPQEWNATRQQLAERGPERRPGDSVGWFRIDDPVALLGFKTDTQLGAYDLTKHPHVVAARRGDDYFALARLGTDASMVRDTAAAWKVEAARTGQDQGRWAVYLTLDGAGAERLKSLTEANIGAGLGIIVDDVLLSAAVINSAVSQHCVISGDYTMREAARIAGLAMAPPLPIAMHMTRAAEAVIEAPTSQP